MKKAFNFEIYTKSPQGQPAWTIEFMNVYAHSEDEAVKTLKTYPKFSSIIKNSGVIPLNEQDRNAINEGSNYRRINPIF